MYTRPGAIGELIRSIRMEAGLTQRQLAALIGADYRERDIQHMESGRRGSIRPEQLGRLFRALEIDLFVLDTIAPRRGIANLALAEPNRRQADSLVHLESARMRLREAMMQSQSACKRTSELLSISSQFRQQPAASGASAAAEPVLLGMA